VNFFRVGTRDEEQVLTSWKFLPTLHYYFPEKRFQSYSERKDIIEKLRRSSFDGVIYTTSDGPAFHHELVKYFSVQPERITQTSAREPEIVYYKILGRLRTAH
jgi:hypothetical protein